MAFPYYTTILLVVRSLAARASLLQQSNNTFSLSSASFIPGFVTLTWFWYESDSINKLFLFLGHLQGFTLHFLEANASDVFPEDANLKTFETRNRTLRSKIAEELEIYRLYNITIAARTAKGTGPPSESFVVRTYGEGQSSELKVFSALSWTLD